MMIKFVSAATILAAAAGAQGAFTFATHGWGDTAGQAYTTSDGSAFFVHSTQDDGTGNPSLIRPLHAASWVAGNDIEWTTYITEGASPSRRSGAPNNQSDLFYTVMGVYPPGFLSANAASVSLGPGTASAGALTGTLFGSSFITGPAIASSQSPEGAVLQGIMLGRMTVHAGAQINGRPNLIGTSAGIGGPASGFNLNLQLNGASAAVPGLSISSNVRLALKSYRVAQVNITDDSFDSDGNPFGAADVYDIWITEVVPTPGVVALAGIAGLTGLRRRRA